MMNWKKFRRDFLLETPRARIILKIIQFVTAVVLIVTLRSFKLEGTIQVTCVTSLPEHGPTGNTSHNGNETLRNIAHNNENYTNHTKEQHQLPSLEHDNNFAMASHIASDNVTTNMTTEATAHSSDLDVKIFYLNITIKYPFRENVIEEPSSCSNTEDEHHLAQWHQVIVHPSERLPVVFVMGVAFITCLYSFLFAYSHARLDFLTGSDIMSEIVTSFILSFLWVTSSISWTASVANIKHFSHYILYYTKICEEDPTAVSCLYSSTGSTMCRLYFSILLCFFLSTTWIACVLLRIYAHHHHSVIHTVLTPIQDFVKGQEKKRSCLRKKEGPREGFTRMSEEDSETMGAVGAAGTGNNITISTIEDKVEYLKPGAEKYVRFYE